MVAKASLPMLSSSLAKKNVICNEYIQVLPLPTVQPKKALGRLDNDNDVGYFEELANAPPPPRLQSCNHAYELFKVYYKKEGSAHVQGLMKSGGAK